MRRKIVPTAAVSTLLAVAFLPIWSAGCDLWGGGLAALPFGRITAVQLFDQPNYTVALTVEGAVANTALIAKINWVFGDGGGFVEGPAGRATITHRYAAPGTYEVVAYLFDAGGYVDQVGGVVLVAPADDGSGPAPEELPDGISGPNPEDEAKDVDVDTTLTWTGSGEATSYDVYLGTSEAAVEAADPATADIFRGSQTATLYNPGGLTPDTQYYWRVDERNAAGVTKGDVLTFTTAQRPEAADEFVPANGAANVPVTQVLRWTAGERTTSHDVYFGKDQSQVDSATPETEDIFQGNQTGSSFDPEDADAEIDGQLLAATTYYWRVDEVGLGGTTEGAVLPFTTAAPPPQITGPLPADGATDVDVNQNMSWSAAPSVESFDVYLGQDETSVAGAGRSSPEFKGSQTAKLFDPATLLGSTTYYWRIDTVGAGGTTKGEVFEFTTAEPPGQVTAPFTPTNNATNVDIDVVLAWNVGAGGTTTSFDVYFGTDEAAVRTGAASASQGNQDASQTSHDPLGPSDLSPDTVYFWRIDAVGPGGTTTGPVLSFRTGALPGRAELPAPANSAKAVALEVVLSWTAGLGATNGHDVYFGTTETAVSEADHFDTEFMGNQAGVTFDPKGAGIPAGDLDGNTTYYWRMDEVSPGGSTKGLIWRFTTAPGRASLPGPADEEEGVALPPALTWTAGAGAASHDVYLGADEAAVAAATRSSPEFQRNQTTTTFTPEEDLEGATTYYWRIDEVGSTGNGTTKGLVWQFTTGAGAAAEPIDPADGATGVELDPTLTWTAGDGAVSHDIYFGTGETTVTNATRASAEYKGNLLAGTEEYTPAGLLTGNTDYFWRIDELDLDGNITKGEVWQFRTMTGPAEGPAPEDLATGVDVSTSLGWTAGSGATRHDVYLGTDEAAVTNADTSTAGIYRGRFTATTYTPPDPLDGDTTYFWRIDEVGPGGITTGEVWEFTTGPGQAADPDPADGLAGVNLDPELSWTAGDGATSHDVYFGTSATAVANATRASAEFRGNQIAATFSPGLLNAVTWYYWRIDELDADGKTSKGKVWQFRTATGPEAATAPIPAEGALDVPTDVLLRWTAGRGAASHDVYFGTSYAAVLNAGTSDAEFKGNQPGTAYDATGLTPATAYFWRIDEVAKDGTTKTAGAVWMFMTAP